MSIDVVEVLPCVPQTMIERPDRARCPSACDRVTTGIPAALAAASSGLSAGIAALEITTISGGAPWAPSASALCPTRTIAPRSARARRSAESRASLPETATP